MTLYHSLLTLLWSEADNNDLPLDRGAYQVSFQLLVRLGADWTRFKAEAVAMGFDPDRDLAEMLHPGNEGDAWNAAAHDFILTRNGHGAGFWDGGWHEPWGSQLTKLAESYGEIHCYVGDDGMIYVE